MHSVGENRKILGVLGGLGPLSSAYFYELITNHTKAEKDQIFGFWSTSLILCFIQQPYYQLNMYFFLLSLCM